MHNGGEGHERLLRLGYKCMAASLCGRLLGGRQLLSGEDSPLGDLLSRGGMGCSQQLVQLASWGGESAWSRSSRPRWDFR